MIPKTKHIFLTAVISSFVQILTNSILLAFITSIFLLFWFFGGRNKGTGKYMSKIGNWSLKIVEKFTLPHEI
jgi:hypothetical protein